MGAKSPLLWDKGQVDSLLAGSPVVNMVKERLKVLPIILRFSFPPFFCCACQSSRPSLVKECLNVLPLFSVFLSLFFPFPVLIWSNALAAQTDTGHSNCVCAVHMTAALQHCLSYLSGDPSHSDPCNNNVAG